MHSIGEVLVGFAAIFGVVALANIAAQRMFPTSTQDDLMRRGGYRILTRVIAALMVLGAMWAWATITGARL